MYNLDPISRTYAGLLSPKFFSTIPYDSITLCSTVLPYPGFTARFHVQHHNRILLSKSKSHPHQPKHIRCLATPSGRLLPYKRFQNLSGVRVFWGPRCARIPETVILLSPSTLGLSAPAVLQLVASIVPPETVHVSRIECKLDLEGISATGLYLITSIKSARKAKRYEDKDTFYFNKRRAQVSYTIYDKARHLGLPEDREVTRVEARLRLGKEERPPLLEFLSGVVRPKEPFRKVMIANPAGLSSLDGRTRNSILRHQSIHNGLKQYAKTHTRRQVDKIRKTVFSNSISLDFLWQPLSQAWHWEFARARRYTQPNNLLPSPRKGTSQLAVPNEAVWNEEDSVWLAKDLRRGLA